MQRHPVSTPVPTLVAVVLLVVTTLVAPVAFAPAAEAATATSLVKAMEPETLYGDTTSVVLTASNGGPDDGFNASFRDVLPAGVTLDSADPGPTATLPQVDGTTVLVWENVADALAGAEVSISYTLSHDTSTYDIGDTFTNAAAVYVSEDPRQVPDFDPVTGAPTGDFDDSATASATTELMPFLLTKSEPSAEGELLRGVHDHQTVYTLEVENNLVVPTTDLVLEDWLPAGLEFLACGGVDNTTTGEEYPSAGAIGGSAPGACELPSLVETVDVDPDGAGPLGGGVHTHVRWSTADLGTPTLAPGATFTLEYVAAIPLRQNVLFGAGAPAATVAEPAATAPGQAANLDNNTGALTADEQAWENYARATGTTDGTTYTSDDTAVVVAENVSIHKTVSGDLAQGGDRTWSLLVETSEYTADGGPITIVDTVPDGLSPLAGPSDYDSAVENGDGTWTVTWNLTSVPAPSGSTTLTLVTDTDTDYASSGGSGPVASNDTVANTVELAAPSATVLTDNDGATSTFSLPDASSASISAEGVDIEKTVATPSDLGDPADCTAAGITWVEQAVDHTAGDTVCWRVALDFPLATDTLDVVVKDFLPAGYAYVGFTYGPGNTVGAAAGFSDEGSFQEWIYPRVDTGGQRFEVIVESTIDDPAAVGDADITANLAKATTTNTAGDVFQLRDQAEAVIAAPVVALDKRIVDVDGATAGFPADAATVVAGDEVAFEVEVSNTGGREAVSLDVTDVLPAELECADVSAVSGAGSCETTPDPDQIEWAGLTVPAGGSVTLSYDVTVPADVAPGQTYVNVATADTYSVETNETSDQTYTPGVDVPPATDDASIITPDASSTKSRVTSIVDGADGNNNAEATIGETVTYTVTGTIPAGTTVQAPVTLTDAVDSGLTIVGTPTYTIDTGSGAGAALPAVVSGQDVTVTVASGPGDYVNPAGSGDDVYTLTIITTVDDEPGNVRNTRLRNDGVLTYFVGGTEVTERDRADTRVVEPDLAVVKDHAGDDIVEADDVVSYTVTVSNDDGGRDSAAHDVEVVDTLPSQLVPQGASGDATDGETLPGGGVWDLTSRTITWDASTVAALAEIEPGDNVALSYDARVEGPLLLSSQLTNQVEATASSLPGAAAGERDSGSPNGDEVGDGYLAQASDMVGPRSPTVAKSTTPSTATIGEPFTSTLTVAIPPDVVGYDATVLDDLPADADYVRTVSSSCTEGGSACSPDITVTEIGESGGTVGWFLGDLDTPSSGERIVTIEYVATVGSGASAGQDLVNSAALHTNGTDDITGTPTTVPSPGDFDSATDPATSTVTVVEPAVTIDKSVAPTAADPGDTLTYTIEVTNGSGPDVSTAYDLTVTDAADDPQLDVVTTATSGLPAGVTLTSGSAAPPYTWTVDELAPGATVTLAYTATLDGSAALSSADVVDNTAEVDGWTSLDTDNLPADAGTPRTYGPADDDVQVDLRFPAVTYDKAVGSGSAAAVNVPFSWVVTVTNSGDGAADDVDVVDTLPVGWAYNADAQVSVDGGTPFSPTNEATSGTPTQITWDDVVGSLAAGSSLTITFTATPAEAAQAATGTGPANPHTNQVTATVGDADGASGNADGPYATNAQDAGETTPATADAFLPAPGSIGDTLWLDRDGDGTQDPGWETTDGGIADVTVVATGTNGVIRTTTTAADGTYLFEDLPPSDYTVSVDTSDPDFPAGLVQTFDADGLTSADASTTTLAAGGTDLAQDFGYTGSGTIGDTVFWDLDLSGTQDGLEPGIGGVTVTLLDSDGDTVASDTTDTDGRYGFDGLPDGDWTVVVTPPAGATQRPVDPDGGADDQSGVTLAPGDRVDVEQDFGYAGDLAIGDTLWLDLDLSGDQTGTEPGLASVTVTLQDGDGRPIATATTDADGRYLFENLPPGDYRVVVDDTTLPGTFSRTFDADGTATPDTSATTLTTADDRTQDFGYAGTGSLGDTVWLDFDADGTVDGDEPGLSGITVELRDDDGALVATTTTDADGQYEFENLPPGDWTVAVLVPAGYDATYDVDGTGTRATATVTLGDGEARDDVDFGFNGTGSIGDTVWADLDASGDQNGGEPGIADVPVRLLLDGDLVATTTTGPDGTYLFEDLPPGDYQVVLDETFLPDGYAPTNDPDGDGTDHESNLTLAVGEADLAQDFGYVGDGRLGDRVWLDRDGDGEQDPDEPGIAAVTVELLDGAGAVIDARVTGDNGGYVFDGLLAGDYSVRIDTATLPGGVIQTFDDDGLGTADQSTTTLSGDPPQPDLDQDFGYVGVLSVGDTVFVDLDEDGAQGSLEPGIAGVTVRLYDDRTGLLVAETVTDADGGYLFEGLDPRTWRVEVDPGTLPVGATQTVDDDGLGTPSTSTTTPLDADDLDQDFGYAFGGIVGDRVFVDLDLDDLDDGPSVDPGLPGVTVELYDGDGELIATTVTDADGNYLFENLPPGTYTVQVDDGSLPTGIAPTVDGDGVGTPNESTVVLPADGVDRDQDFGYRGTSGLGDRVWFDDDVDGIQDDDEASVAGIAVRLYTADDPSTVIRTTTTDAGGGYLFPQLPPGDYVVEFVTPDGAQWTPNVDAGTDDTVDSDAVVDTGRTGRVALPADTTDTSVDAGLVRYGSIGDLVFDDLDGDGIQGADEPGVPGVVVDLYDPEDLSAPVASVTTGDDGLYRFEDLLPGDWIVGVTLPDGAVFTVPDVGDDDTRDSDFDAGRLTVTIGPDEDRRDVDAGIRRIAELTIEKVADGALAEGGAVAYTITVTNDGPSDVPGAVTVTDEVPAGLVWTGEAAEGWTCELVGTDVVCVWAEGLPDGASAELTLVFDVTAPEGETIVNVATVTGGGVVAPGGGDATAQSGEVTSEIAAAGAGQLPVLLVTGLLALLLGAWVLRRSRPRSSV